MATVSTTATMVTIPVNPETFVNVNSNLLSLLKEINKFNFGKGIPTSELCDKVFNSRRKGMRIIEEAEHSGYIYRYDIKSKDKGYHYKMNVLSPAGKKLLSKLE